MDKKYLFLIGGIVAGALTVYIIHMMKVKALEAELALAKKKETPSGESGEEEEENTPS